MINIIKEDLRNTEIYIIDKLLQEGGFIDKAVENYWAENYVEDGVLDNDMYDAYISWSAEISLSKLFEVLERINKK